jgi:Xaa-Pro aminopeptidase
MGDATGAEIEAMGGSAARIGYDGADMHLPVDIIDGLRAGLPKATLVAAGGIVESGRVVKSASEIAIIRETCALSVSAMEAGIAHVCPGVTENAIAGVIYHEMMKGGSGLLSN